MELGISQYRVESNSKINLQKLATEDKNSPKKSIVRDEMIPQLRPQLRDLQEQLYAE
ncbi:MAG TPA: hypothetical protein GX717_02295, partial [Clostridiaceae bacterium]|nr:hypothetical protein [Clostridiaceae bacterium]